MIDKPEYNSIALGQLLDKSELEIALNLINQNDYKKLREFLNSIKDKLEKKGISADYLYYLLEHQFKSYDFIMDKEFSNGSL